MEIEDVNVANVRRREELVDRLRRIVEDANPSALDILEDFAEAAETNEDVRRKRASGEVDPLGGDQLACFYGGRLDGNGPDVKPADREACGERLRELERKSKIQAKFHARELSLLDLLRGDEE